MDDINQLSFRKDSLYDCCYIPGVIGDSHIDFTSYSGGGVSGLALAGVYDELYRRNYSRSIKYWVGSSIGAAIALVSALNINPADLLPSIESLDPAIFLDFGGKEGTTNFWTSWNTYRYGIPEFISKYGLVRGVLFHQWLRQYVSNAGYDPDMTFAKFYDVTGNHLVVTTTSLNTSETLYLSRSSYPSMRLRCCPCINDLSVSVPAIVHAGYTGTSG